MALTVFVAKFCLNILGMCVTMYPCIKTLFSISLITIPQNRGKDKSEHIIDLEWVKNEVDRENL